MDGQCGYADVMDGTACDFGGLPGVCTVGVCEKAKQWGIPVTIDDGAGESFTPMLAVDPTGKVVVGWTQLTGSVGSIWTNRYVPGAEWGSPEEIDDSAQNAYQVQVALDRTGNAIAVWEEYDGTYYRVRANTYGPSTGWGTPEPLQRSGETASWPHVAFDHDGNAIAVWTQDDGATYNIWANRYMPTGGWLGDERISNDGSWLTNVPRVAFDPDGNATAVWQQRHAGGWDDIWANRFTPLGAWTTPDIIGTGGIPRVAVDPAGNAIVAWSGGSNRYTPSAGWIGPLSVPVSGARPELAVDQDGNAIAVWNQRNGAQHNIWASRFTPARGWGPAELIENNDEGYDPSNAEVALDPDGNAIAVWNHNASYTGTGNDIWANRFTPTGGWGTEQLIETGDGDAGSPQIVFDANGDATVVWHQSDGATYRIWANRFE
jgi:hypothetical protein